MAYTTKQEIFAQSNTWVLDLTRTILTHIEAITHPVKTRTAARVGTFNDSDAHLAALAIGMEPEPFGLAHVYQCIPYANPELFRQDLEGAVRRGWLIINAAGSYQPTDRSRQYHNCLHDELENIYSRLRPLPMMQLERLDALLGEIISNIDQRSSMAYKPAFDMERRLAPPARSTLQKVCCKLSHLMAFRDDAYLNAWMDQDINSHVWEAFSLIYKGKAHTAAALAAKLGPARQYDEAAYQSALVELIERAWVSKSGGKYEPTPQGLTVLAQVARTMTRCFFEPWEGLQETKIEQLKILMEALLKALKSTQNKRWAGQPAASRQFGWRAAQWLRDKER